MEKPIPEMYAKLKIDLPDNAGFAWSRADILSFLKDPLSEGFAVLGGDVVVRSGGSFEYTGDNWYTSGRETLETSPARSPPEWVDKISRELHPTSKEALMAFLKHRFGKTFYLTKGSTSKPTVVCLHGGPGGTHRLLKKLFFKLAPQFRVIVYDQHGGGKSTPSAKKHWKIETFVEELDLLLEHLKVDSVFLLGASWGTTLALEYYLRHPEKIRGIIFQSPLFSTSDWMKDAKILIGQMPGASRKILRANVAGKSVDAKELEKHHYAYYLRHVLRNEKHLKKLLSPKDNPPSGRLVYEHMWGSSEFYASGTLKKYDRRSKLKDVAVPVQLICGEFDEARPETSAKYVKRFPDARLHVVKGASHVITLEKPTEYLKVVRNFLRKNS